MEVTKKNATHALLGNDGLGVVGIVAWHSNELDAHRHAKQINSSCGRVKVIPVENGELSKEHNLEKSDLFSVFYDSVIQNDSTRP